MYARKTGRVVRRQATYSSKLNVVTREKSKPSSRCFSHELLIHPLGRVARRQTEYGGRCPCMNSATMSAAFKLISSVIFHNDYVHGVHSSSRINDSSRHDGRSHTQIVVQHDDVAVFARFKLPLASSLHRCTAGLRMPSSPHPSPTRRRPHHDPHCIGHRQQTAGDRIFDRPAAAPFRPVRYVHVTQLVAPSGKSEPTCSP